MLELPALLNAFVTVCNTVAYAHSRGVVHRDLKGQNVMLGDFGEVVILDWGLAKLVGQPEGDAPAASVVFNDAGSDGHGHTLAGEALGTPAYMSPEQAAGRPDLIDHRTDVYGLGAILYEILTGEPPFTGDSTMEVLQKVREKAPTPPRQLWPEAPPALEVLCLRALAKRPEERPSAAAQLAHEVQGWQERERRQAEEALRESEALYRSLVDVLPLILTRKDLECRFTFANNRACKSFGKTLEEVLGKTDFDFFPAELAEQWQQVDREVFETGKTVELPPFRYIDLGQERYYQGIKTPLYDLRDEIIGVQIVIWDMTEQKRLADALRQSEALYQSLVENLPCMVVRKDLQGRFTFANHGLSELVGRPLDEVLGKTDFDFFSRELAEKYRRDDRQVIESGEVKEIIEETTSALGRRYFHVLKTAVRDAADKAIGIQLVGWDITDRKLAEEELRKSRERFELAVRASQHGLWEWDVEANEVWYSDQTRTMLGYDEQEFPNRPGESEKRIHPDDHARWRAGLEELAAGVTDHFESEHRIRHKDGSYRWVRSCGVALRHDDGKVYRVGGSLADITDRKAAEEKLALLRLTAER